MLRRGPRTAHRPPPPPHRRQPTSAEPHGQRRRRRPPQRPPRAAAAHRRSRRSRSQPPQGAAGAGEAAEHHRSEGHEHPEAHADRQGPDRRRRDRHAQAGADLPDPQGADRAERVHLLGRRARSAARRLRLPARARLQLPAGPRRHLRLAVADPQVRPADRRHRVRARSARRRKASATSR